MPATQISFAAFALSQQAAIDCTPPAQPLPGPSSDAGLVTQPSVGGGECIPVGSVLNGHWGCSLELRDDFVHGGFFSDGLIGSVSGAGMDAPRDLPSGSHKAYVCGAAYSWRYVVVTGFTASRGC